MANSKRFITDLSHEEAKDYLLKSSSYFDLDLPPYFNFEPLLSFAYDKTEDIDFGQLRGWKPDRHQGLNYTLMSNKDGAIAWRPYELLNPLIYAFCVRLLTSEQNWRMIVDCFSSFAGGVVECCSIPVVSEQEKSNKKEQILTWWKRIEQRSLELSLEFSHCTLTDVTNCYPSIYSHAIAWAVHDRDFAKSNPFDKSLLGNQLDILIRNSREGQTNGIPQASLLSHIFAELVLGYCDTMISKKLSENDGIKILRYRDDYRIFGNSDSDCANALKVISEELITFGMRLGASKTTDEKNLISGSVKREKMKALKVNLNQRTLQKDLLIIHDYCLENPGAGATKQLLSKFTIRLRKARNRSTWVDRENSRVLIAILLDIGAISPIAFPAIAEAISLILDRQSNEEKVALFELILKRAKRIPNNGYLELWLQRIAIPNNLDFSSNEAMSKLLEVNSNSIWNFNWIDNNKLRESLKKYSIVDQAEISNLKTYIEPAEIDAFWNHDAPSL